MNETAQVATGRHQAAGLRRPALRVLGTGLLASLLLGLAFIPIFEPATSSLRQYGALEGAAGRLLVLTALTAIVLGLWTKTAPSSVCCLLGACFGSLLFVAVAGLRTLDPREIAWVMRWDWQNHFLGWHFFRREPWHLPPGTIEGLIHPLGTSIGYTDSIPIAALLLKPVNGWLPENFQYVGLWLLTCFALQGAFGALLVGVISRHLSLNVLGSLVFVLSPVLLNRVGHPALATHWLLVAGLWVYFRQWEDKRLGSSLRAWILLVGVSAAVHPYLAAMVLGLAAAHQARLVWVDQRQRPARGLAEIAGLVGLTLVIWWICGLFVGSASPSSEQGFGYYSLNLLAPVAAMDNSLLLRDLPLAGEGQYEGFNYLGVGILLLVGWSLYELTQRNLDRRTWIRLSPLITVCVLFTLFALSTKVTLGPYILFDLPVDLPVSLTIFRATGRFFWPTNYLILFATVGMLIVRSPVRRAVVLLFVAVAIQAIDLQVLHRRVVATRVDPAWHTWANPLQSATWAMAAPHYRHVVVVPPAVCGSAFAPESAVAYFAGRFGLTVNVGFASRPNLGLLAEYCDAMRRTLERGLMRDDTLYIVHPQLVARFLEAAGSPVECDAIDGLHLCATVKSRLTWQSSRK